MDYLTTRMSVGIPTFNLGCLFKDDEKGFVNGIARVKNGDKWGFIRLDGTVLGNQWYDNAELFKK